MDFDFFQPDVKMQLSNAHQAAMRSVVFPLTAGHDVRRLNQYDMLSQLQVNWRARVQALGRAGWSPLNSETTKNTQFLRNCPPVCALSRVTSRKCHRINVCPSCYARDVVMDTFDSIKYGKQRCRPDDQLAVVKLINTSLKFSSRTASEWVSTFKTMRNIDLNNFRHVLGSRVLWSFAAVADRNLADDVVIRRTTFMFLSAVSKQIAPLGPGCTQRRVPVSKLNDKMLMRLISWGIPYPVGMMRGNAELAARILDMLAANRTKMINTDGLMLNRTERELVRASIALISVVGKT